VKRKYNRLKRPLLKASPRNIRRPAVPLAKAHAILMLAFGEDLKNPSDKLMMPINEISRTSKMSAPYVCSLIKKFRDNDGDVRDRRFDGRPIELPPGVREFALSKKTLKLSAHMSLEMKCRYI
jgi:hypothetical protein